MPTYKVEDEADKLTIEEMNYYDMYKDIKQRLANCRGQSFTDNYVNGLPVGLRLPSGFVGGAL